jgi:hypothetical protein
MIEPGAPLSSFVYRLALQNITLLDSCLDSNGRHLVDKGFELWSAGTAPN